MEISSSTVELLDQVEKETQYDYETRKNSAICITLIKRSNKRDKAEEHTSALTKS